MWANKIESVNTDLMDIFRLEEMDSVIHKVHPLIKLITCLVYIITVISFDKYSYFPLFIMILFPITLYQFSMIPVHTCFYKLRMIIPFICFVGIFNPFFDRVPAFYIASFGVTYGMISFVTVLLKGILCLMASFLLIATTRIEDICQALLLIHCPRILVNVISLSFRYIFVLVDETGNMWENYKLRAPKQRGIAINAWGSFLGQLIIRSMDRSRRIYENMLLRGYDGSINNIKSKDANEKSSFGLSIFIAMVICGMMIFVRVGISA